MLSDRLRRGSKTLRESSGLRKVKAVRTQRGSREENSEKQVTPGKEFALAIARAFPDCFTVYGERIAVRNDAGTEATRAMVRAELEAQELAEKKQRQSRERALRLRPKHERKKQTG